ncbi:hypothetical protein DFR86_11600 [Acidianus sulfidivorans JP7]|uniref:Uncharacterized protein n=1 Tax=Acidianus sulfidivorans JP7 TaxID=619593 RepID=A0A2U9IQ24_9CREN|nr:hypothetical protein [Acidianus sulfidivorans]AWR98115.1 hypothetical protein DFR86_11600 [Acidianus sulfidivorans JP7]
MEVQFRLGIKLHTLIINNDDEVISSEVEPSIKVGKYTFYLFLEEFVARNKSNEILYSKPLPLKDIISQVIELSAKEGKKPELLNDSFICKVIYDGAYDPAMDNLK